MADVVNLCMFLDSKAEFNVIPIRKKCRVGQSRSFATRLLISAPSKHV
jgi:hypothetical protein